MTSGGAFGYNVGEGNEIMNERLNEVLESKEVLIFDFDGTMTGTEHFNYLVHKKNWKKYGIDLTEDEYKKVMGKTVVDLKERIKDDYGDINAQVLINEYVNGFLELTKNEDLTMYPFVQQALQNSDGKKIYILSNQSTRIIDACIEKWGIRDKFEKIISLMDLKDLKKIDYYRDTEKYFGAPQADCVLFEDTQKNIDDGMSCGIYTVAVKHQFNNPVADLIIDVTSKGSECCQCKCCHK